MPILKKHSLALWKVDDSVIFLAENGVRTTSEAIHQSGENASKNRSRPSRPRSANSFTPGESGLRAEAEPVISFDDGQKIFLNLVCHFRSDAKSEDGADEVSSVTSLDLEDDQPVVVQISKLSDAPGKKDGHGMIHRRAVVVGVRLLDSRGIPVAQKGAAPETAP
jgi:hypothetical protein